MKGLRFPQRVKLGLTSQWPAFMPYRVAGSDEPILPDPATDNITYRGPRSVQVVDFAGIRPQPGEIEKPTLGPYWSSDVLQYGPTPPGLGPSSGPAFPATTPWYHEMPFYGLPPTLWRPFQPQPMSHAFPPQSFGDSTVRLVAGSPDQVPGNG